MLIRILLSVTVLMISACAQLAPVRDNIVIGVQKYCTGFSLEQRRIFRTEANESLRRVCVVLADGTQQCGASITVTCPGDPIQ